MTSKPDISPPSLPGRNRNERKGTETNGKEQKGTERNGNERKRTETTNDTRPRGKALPYLRSTRIALLVAGGTGTRMGADVPKQFLSLAGQPVLLHTLRRFAEAAPDARLIVVLPSSQHAYWQELLTAHADVPPHQVIAGGATRLASVKCGLMALADAPDDALVAVHDGVRPLIAAAVIQEAYRVAAERGSAVAAVVLKDSIRRMTSVEISVSEDRATFRLVQTPQTFSLGTLRRAYAAIADDDATLTDDASVVERLGLPITLIPGDYANLKITTPEDLVVAEALLRRP